MASLLIRACPRTVLQHSPISAHLSAHTGKCDSTRIQSQPTMWRYKSQNQAKLQFLHRRYEFTSASTFAYVSGANYKNALYYVTSRSLLSYIQLSRTSLPHILFALPLTQSNIELRRKRISLPSVSSTHLRSVCFHLFCSFILSVPLADNITAFFIISKVYGVYTPRQGEEFPKILESFPSFVSHTRARAPFSSHLPFIIGLWTVYLVFYSFIFPKSLRTLKIVIARRLTTCENQKISFLLCSSFIHFVMLLFLFLVCRLI